MGTISEAHFIIIHHLGSDHIVIREGNMVLIKNLKVHPELIPIDNEPKVNSNCISKILS